jgi:hypothetical protein
MADRSHLLSIASRFVTMAAALGSVALALYAGRTSHQWLIVAIIAVWVATPFAALLLADRKLKVKHESAPMRDALHWLMIAVSVASLLVYLRVALGPLEERAARAFVLVPTAASVISGILITVVAFIRSQPRSS